MEIPCTFHDFKSSSDDIFYRCLIRNQDIQEDEEYNMIGQHSDDRTSNDVTYVQFNTCTITKIPKGLTKLFPNMQALCILESKLKNVSKNDLTEYKNLKRFLCKRNEIEFLPFDLFEDFRNLEWVSFFGNKLRVIEPNILDGLGNLKVVCLRKNINFNKFYSVYKVHPANSSLKELYDELDDRFYESEAEFIKNYAKKLQNSTKIGLVTDIKALIRDENSKDFTITINSHEFHVHKFLLTARSPTFAELLKNNPEVENLNLVDIPVDIFEQILNFFYTDELPSEDETNFIHLLSAANRLQIKKVKNYAAENISKQLNQDNALDIFKMSHKYQQNELREKSYEELKQKYPEIEFKDEWVDEPEKVEKIIQGYLKMEADIQAIKEQFKVLLTES